MKQVSIFCPFMILIFQQLIIYLKVMEGFTWCLKQDIKETGSAWIAILGNKNFTKASATTFQILKNIGMSKYILVELFVTANLYGLS